MTPCTSLLRLVELAKGGVTMNKEHGKNLQSIADAISSLENTIGSMKEAQG